MLPMVIEQNVFVPAIQLNIIASWHTGYINSLPQTFFFFTISVFSFMFLSYFLIVSFSWRLKLAAWSLELGAWSLELGPRAASSYSTSGCAGPALQRAQYSRRWTLICFLLDRARSAASPVFQVIVILFLLHLVSE